MVGLKKMERTLNYLRKMAYMLTFGPNSLVVLSAMIDLNQLLFLFTLRKSTSNNVNTFSSISKEFNFAAAYISTGFA